MRLFINYKPSPQSKHALKKIEWLKWSGEKYNLWSKKFWWKKICFKHAIGNRKLLTNGFQSREGVIIKCPLNGQFNNACDVILMSRTDVR